MRPPMRPPHSGQTRFRIADIQFALTSLNLVAIECSLPAANDSARLQLGSSLPSTFIMTSTESSARRVHRRSLQYWIKSFVFTFACGTDRGTWGVHDSPYSSHRFHTRLTQFLLGFAMACVTQFALHNKHPQAAGDQLLADRNEVKQVDGQSKHRGNWLQNNMPKSC